ncbi:proline dehydrogenase family protein [Dictyobacter aurantiacus]|uniref:proline dehydrogenase n=1 Tax=Dictyobacter aurantiacus TaxID=1936993 RepID=A0A401ZBP6_9CHLR|nr:proline dehydrogenase family protein [Dictyobacter aurantiacus]GCE04213.1 proline dehydrogenase [Dictyobacter aurantiacus]
MLKDTLLYLAQNPRLRDFVVQNKLTRNVSRRFVAGEVLEDALRATRALNDRGIQVALDLLGENVAIKEEAAEAMRDYVNAIELIARTQIDANISIKLTALGLDISPQLCEEYLNTILESGREHNVFVCIDMEGSAYTEQTVALASRARERYELVGTVIQSYLYRSHDDIIKLVDQGTRIRLVKGAYQESQSVAYQEKADVDRNYVELMHILLARGNFPAIASHDEAIIDDACRFVRDHGISKSSFEFQMLYGIRRDLQDKLVKQGYNVRVYVPYGSHWYPYLMRRMAERPANLMFVVTNALR